MSEAPSRPPNGSRHSEQAMKLWAAVVVAVTAVGVMSVATLAGGRADVAGWTLAGAALFLLVIFLPRRS